MNPDIELGDFSEQEFTTSAVNNMTRFTDFSPLTKAEEATAASAIVIR
ncbi:hypothetical protein ACWCYZ_23475 [Streptomyces virginiae]